MSLKKRLKKILPASCSKIDELQSQVQEMSNKLDMLQRQISDMQIRTNDVQDRVYDSLFLLGKK